MKLPEYPASRCECMCWHGEHLPVQLSIKSEQWANIPV